MINQVPDSENGGESHSSNDANKEPKIKDPVPGKDVPETIKEKVRKVLPSNFNITRVNGDVHIHVHSTTVVIEKVTINQVAPVKKSWIALIRETEWFKSLQKKFLNLFLSFLAALPFSGSNLHKIHDFMHWLKILLHMG